MYTQETWDARYAESERIWSGRPNQRLVEEVADLAPGRVLDVGCGEGADAVWLAEHGWQVTALDVSEVALARVMDHAAEAGRRRSGRDPPPRPDGRRPGARPLRPGVGLLLPRAARGVRRASTAGWPSLVEPGGTLLVVGHHPDDHDTGVRRPHGAQLLFTPEQVAAVLDPGEWDVVKESAPTREMAGPEGPVTVRDSVVRAVRR